MFKVSIVIVNWQTGSLLANCLQSILALPEAEKKLLGKVVIVDNDSADDSLAQAKRVVGEEGALFEFLAAKQNLGFARANNLGINYLRENSLLPSHVWLLNPDTKVLAGALAQQLKIFERQPKAGLVGAQLLNPDGTIQASLRPFPTLLTFVLYALKLGRWVNFPTYNYAQEQSAEQIMGASFLIRAQVLTKVGLLDENFFVWFEEVDYCLRVRQAGWQVIYTPAAKVIHYGGVSFNQLAGFRKAWPWLKSSLYYTRKHLGLFSWLILLLLSPLTLLLVIPATLRHSKQQNYTHG